MEAEADAPPSRPQRSRWQWVVAALTGAPALLAVPTVLAAAGDDVPGGLPVALLGVVLYGAVPLAAAWLATRADAPWAPVGLAMVATWAVVGHLSPLRALLAVNPARLVGVDGALAALIAPPGAAVPVVTLLGAVHAVRVRADPRRIHIPTWPAVTAAAIAGWALSVTLPALAPVLRSLPAAQQPVEPLAGGASPLLLMGLGAIAWFVGRKDTLLIVPAAVVVTAIAVLTSLGHAAALLTSATVGEPAARISVSGPVVGVQVAVAGALAAATWRLALAARDAWCQQRADP